MANENAAKELISGSCQKGWSFLRRTARKNPNMHKAATIREGAISVPPPISTVQSSPAPITGMTTQHNRNHARRRMSRASPTLSNPPSTTTVATGALIAVAAINAPVRASNISNTWPSRADGSFRSLASKFADLTKFSSLGVECS